MDLKTEYIIKQLGRTKNKKYEMYVVNRIVNLINDFDIKFITQQYVSRPDSYALIDLYFPQLKIQIEIDEDDHKNNIEADKIREEDIANATDFDNPIRINCYQDKTIQDINQDIDECVKRILEKKAEQIKNDEFTPWEIEAEFNPETYINLGYIDIKDNVAFHKIVDGCNCFGHNYKGWYKGGAKHAKDDNILIWFPKLYKNEDWDNSISPDEELIIEKPLTEKYKNHTQSYLENKDKYPQKRIVFARVKDNLGNILYRFRGMYELDNESSSIEKGLYWKRIATRVETLKYNIQDT